MTMRRARFALLALALAAAACGGGSSDSATPTFGIELRGSTRVVVQLPTPVSEAVTGTPAPPAAATQAPVAETPFVSPPTAIPTVQPTPSADAAEICASNAPDVITGTVQTPELTEISGIALSRHHPGVIWAHNDSGDSARFFALDTSGALLATYALPGVTAVDWEDMAILHTAREDELLVGDVGDNLSLRPDIVVYEVQEPDPARDGPGEHDVSFTAIHLSYPDGAHNAESLVIDPKPGPGVAIVTKDITGGPSGVYEFDLVYPVPLTLPSSVLRHVAEIPFGALSPAKVVPDGSPPLPTAAGKIPTGGALSPTGDVIAVRTYGTVWLWSVAAGESLADVFARPPCEGPSAIEAQGEAIAFDADGGGYWTVSEGAGAALHHFRWR